MNRSMLTTSALLLSCSLALAYPARAGGSGAELLDFLSDAQHANLGRYHSGRMAVAFETGFLGEPSYRLQIDAEVRWDGPNSRIEGTRRANMEPKSPTPRLSSEKILVIRTEQAIFSYIPDSHLARFERPDKGTGIEFTHLRPADWWYGRRDGAGSDWAVLLGELRSKVGQTSREVTVKELDSDRIEAASDNFKGDSLRLVTSKRFDGNVLEFTATRPSDAGLLVRKQTYAWDLKGKDVYLRRFDFEFSRDSGKLEGNYMRYRVDSFDPNDKPAARQFDARAVTLAGGTRVIDGIRGRSDRVGERPQGSVVDQLDRLAPEIKDRGFSKSKP